MRRQSWKTVVSIGVLAFLMCTDSPTSVVVPPNSLQVRSLQGAFDPTDNTVLLTWTAPTDLGSFDFYTVYRTSEFDEETGEADTSKLEATHIGRNVNKNETSHSDVPGLDNGRYLYAVRAVRVDVSVSAVKGTVRDTVVGALVVGTNIVEVQVGTDVSFNINRGDIFTVTDRCSLIINDPVAKLSKVRLTQKYRTYLVNGDERIEVHFDDPLSPPSDAEIAYYVDAGWLDSRDLVLEPGVQRMDYPDFEAPDAENPLSVRDMTLPGVAQGALRDPVRVPWTLLKGNGSKRVWAEFTYAGTGVVDTVTDNIEIAPWRIQINFRNKIDCADETMRKRDNPPHSTLYYVYKPWMRFSVSVFADTTIEEDFDYWFVTPESLAAIDEEIRSERAAWLETKPRSGTLTGLGPEHDDEKIYTYMLHPDSTEGRENLSRFLRVRRQPDDDVAFKLIGPSGEEFNSTCVPGSYWGPNPVKWNYTKKRMVPKQEAIEDPTSDPGKRAANMYDRLMTMEKFSIASQGKKEFFLVARFTGRYFRDTRVMLSSGELFTRTRFARWGAPAVSYMDIYPPVIYLDDKNAWGCFLNNGSVVASQFCYGLVPGGSVADLGQADISDLRLIIAKRPSWMPWVVEFEGAKVTSSTADTLTLETMLNLRAHVFPYEIKTQNYALQEVVWEDLDPSGWPSGEYLMAVYVSDEFGNEGFARFSEEGFTNPWLIDVQTGK